MKLCLFLLLAISLTSCAQSGYAPSYIISEVEQDAYAIDE